MPLIAEHLPRKRVRPIKNPIECIYKIEFVGTNHLYIGSAFHLPLRKTNHLSDLRRGTHCNNWLQHCYNKYGPESMRIEILEKCRLNELQLREQYYLDHLLPGLNILKTARRSDGYKHSEQTKDKLKIIAQQRVKNDLWIQKTMLTRFKKGRVCTEKEKEEMRIRMTQNNPFRGRQHSDEAKLKMSVKAKRRTKFNSQYLMSAPLRKKIIQKTLSGEIINTFPSITAAVVQFNIKNITRLANACNAGKIYRGFLWEWSKIL